MIGRPNIRQLAEEREESLSPHAAKSKYSQGRQRPEEPCPVRTAFQRDRDRIIHSKAFRRLKHKTQVFIAPLGDHYVTRLTHTLEVAQIARTIARALNLNEDLTEAIALGHDLGHTPFGHIGEDTLNELYHRGFRHSEQSLRVVELLENEGHGLNLTWEVRDGILHHSKERESIRGGEAGTLEGEVVRISDSIAYINHDIDDAIRAGMLSEGDLPLAAITVLGNTRSLRINTMVVDIIDCCWPSMADARQRPSIAMSPEVLEATDTLRNFLFQRVYNIRSAQEESEKARDIIRSMYKYFKENADKMPAEYRFYSDELERRVVDYIAGMTDQYAMRMGEELFPSRKEPPPARKKPKTKKPPEARTLPLFGEHEVPPP
jgi:dGTPase